jgi:FAD-linked sulfhydryl oxidase
MTLRFPDKPTDSDRQLLLRFFNDFSQLYPCGECASHFQKLLKELPPQTSSRMASALWLCAAHNKVNERLGKAEFPCDKLDETYDCGCGDDKKAVGSSGKAEVTPVAA